MNTLFYSCYEFSVEQTTPTGHTVGQLEATDDDLENLILFALH